MHQLRDYSNRRYFSVMGEEEEEVSTELLNGLIASSIQEARQRDEEHYRTLNRVKDNTSLVTKTPWLRHTQWEQTFMGKDMEELVKLTESPEVRDNDERSLWDSTSRVINQCWKGFLNCGERGWSLIPFWLASVDRTKENTKPFRTYIASATLQRYIGYWQQYLIFCIRSIMLESAVQFTPRQDQCLRELMGLLDEEESVLDAKVLELSVLLIRHSDYASQKSSLIYFSGVMGYKVEWKQWRQPHDYTTILAGLQFCIRVVMLESALPRRYRDDFTEDLDMNPVDKFRTVRDKWLVDGEGTYDQVIC